MRPLRTPLPSFAVAMTVLLAITTIQHLANAERCADVAAPGHHTCEQHAAWGKCEESWIADGGYCRRTCGKCSAGSANGVLSAVTERAKACGLDDATREDVAQELRSLLSSPSFDRAEDDDDDQLAVRERSNNPLMATLALPEFGARLNRWDVGCLIQGLAEDDVYDIVDKLLARELMGGEAPKKYEELFDPNNLSKLLFEFFHDGGCRTAQLVALLPSLVDALHATDADMLGAIYATQGTDTTRMGKKANTVSYVKPYGGSPSASTCFGKNLKLLLSARQCTGYNCYNHTRG